MVEFSRYFSASYLRGFCYFQRFGKLLGVGAFLDGRPLQCIFKLHDVHENGAQEFSLEFMCESGGVPNDVMIQISGEKEQCIHSLVALHEQILAVTEPELTDRFIDEVNKRRAGGRPKLLDVGGRARSRKQYSEDFPDWDCVVLDIIDQAGVDVVCDAHLMSEKFAPESFDAVMSISVFEHILMPWKVCLEINKVLKPGGFVLIHTHQTIGMHDMPWDFWRFSDQSWNALFNRKAGFELIETRMNGFSRVIPAVFTDRHNYAEKSGGFEGSIALARKIGRTELSWNVAVNDALSTRYPEHEVEA